MIKHVVSFSGGMGSFAEAAYCVELYGAKNVSLLFADTLIEDQDLHRFMADCINFLRCEFIALKDGRTPFQVFKDVKFMGNTRVDPCSKILKRDLINGYIRKHWQPDEIEVHLGVDYSEEHRLHNVQSRMHPYIYRSTLVENGLIIAKDFSLQFGIKPPRLYEFGLGHNNCGGFCVKAGLGHFKRLLNGDREQYLRFENEEASVYVDAPETRPFLRKRRNGKVSYITLKQYREALDLDSGYLSEDEELELGGCGCALEDA